MASPRPARILVVDDEDSVCRLCVALLGKGGHAVKSVNNAFDAMREVRANHYDIVLTDIRMPDISGETLIDRVREVRPEAMPIIMTGYPTMELATAAPGKGVYDFLTKPFQPDQLEGAVRRAMARRDQELERARQLFAASLRQMEQRLGDHFDLPAAIDDLLGASVGRAGVSSKAATGPATRQSATAPAAAPRPPASQATAAPQAPAPAKTARRVGDLSNVSAPLSAESPGGDEEAAFDTSQPLFVVLCEPIPRDQAVLKESDSYRHFRTIYAAHRVLSEQLEAQEAPVQIQLVMAAHNADIPAYFRRHARRICCVIFGPNMTKLSESGVRVTANGSRGRQVVVCHNPERMGFTWDQLREMGRHLDIWGCRSDAPLEEVREFWTRFFGEELLRFVQQQAGDAGDAEETAGNPLSREEIQKALARDAKAVDVLPAFPHVCRQALEAIDQGRRFTELADIVGADGSLQAALIRAANVTRFGSRERIKTLPNALSRIGLQEARKIVVGATVQELTQKVAEAGFDAGAYFRHCASAGLFAQILAVDADSPAAKDREIMEGLDLPPYAQSALRKAKLWKRFRLHDGFDPFTAGILHDLGKLLNAICYPDAWPVVLHEYETSRWKGSLLAAEQAVVGDFQHPVSGGALLDRWSVFSRLVDPIRDHHKVARGASPGAALIGMANCLAKGVHPFPKAIAIAPAFRRDHLQPVKSQNSLTNPLPAAFELVDRPFREGARNLPLVPEPEVEPMTREQIGVILAAADTAGQGASGKVYLDALTEQNPEVDGLLAWLQMRPRELLSLQLLLQPVVTARVEGLCGAAGATD